MSINQSQFEKLTEMGISLWQSRTDVEGLENLPINTPDYIHIDLAELTKQTLFRDILLAIGLSIGEVSNQEKYLDLGLFNWYFFSNEPLNKAQSQPLNTIQWLDQQLITPTLAEIAMSPALKKQLWQVLGKQAQ